MLLVCVFKVNKEFMFTFGEIIVYLIIYFIYYYIKVKDKIKKKL